ncbi:MAG: hypothetical protein ACFB6R_11675 [Alphaproteobacteria bacterium]
MAQAPVERGVLAERFARPLFALPGSPALRGSVHRSVTWWLGELLAAMPQGAVRTLARIGARTVLHIRPDGVDLWSVSVAGQWQPLGHSPIAPAEPGLKRDVAKALAAMPDFKTHGDVSVLLDPGLVLERSVVLPDADSRTLQGLLSLDLDRFMPVDETSADLAFRVTGRCENAATVRVTLACIRPQTLQDLADGLARDGVRPQRFAHWSAAAGGLLSFRTRDQERRSRADRRRTGIALAAGAVALGAVFAAPWLMIQSERQALEADLAGVRQEARRAALARQQVQGAQAHFARVADHLTASPAPLPLLARLTDALPDTAHLDHFSLRGTGEAGRTLTVQVKGSGEDSTRVLRRLGSLAGVTSARHGAPVRIDPASGREAFTIDLSLDEAGEGRP